MRDVRVRADQDEIAKEIVQESVVAPLLHKQSVPLGASLRIYLADELHYHVLKFTSIR